MAGWPATGCCDNRHQGGLYATEMLRCRDQVLKSGWQTSGALDLTPEQLAFLIDLRRGTCRATAAQDASVIGPLIRANLVSWDDVPSDGGTGRKPPGSTFTLTPLGEECLAVHDARGDLS